jgi:O-methyltransferase involved in polyketide biosynthesis
MAPHSADQIPPGLSGVSNTMLWALHNRAIEAARQDSVLDDPGSVHIHQSIDYDFDRHFGIPRGSLAARAAGIDQALRQWLHRHPDGIVVSLGEGLETQRQRVDNRRVHWLSVDLPEAISLRERFLTPTDRFRHIATSALDPAWMDAVDPMADVFIVAQGLLMYLQPATVQTLFANIGRRFPTAEMVFDVVPRWFSHLTLLGLDQTPHYRLPPMPWGINRNEVEPTLQDWVANLDSVMFLDDYRVPRGWPQAMAKLVHHLPFLRNEVPSLVHIVVATNPLASNIIPFRKKSMTSLSSVFDAATRSAKSQSDLTNAAGQIIAKRVALGVAAVFDPTQADHAEFGRIVPEKMEAFSAAGMIVMQQASLAGEQIKRFASDAIMTATRATLAVVGSTSPAAMVKTQGRIAVTWFEQATANFMAISMLALNAQEAAIVPIQQTIAANTERLGRTGPGDNALD